MFTVFCNLLEENFIAIGMFYSLSFSDEVHDLIPLHENNQALKLWTLDGSTYNCVNFVF